MFFEADLEVKRRGPKPAVGFVLFCGFHQTGDIIHASPTPLVLQIGMRSTRYFMSTQGYVKPFHVKASMPAGPSASTSILSFVLLRC